MDFETFLSPLPGDEPAGVDFDVTGFLLALDNSIGWADAAPRGASEWRAVQDQIEEGFAESRDLRLAVALAVTLLNLEGIPAFGRGIAFVRSFIERLWDTSYPLIEEDGNADTRRNTLLNLVGFHRVLRPLNTATLIEHAGVGRFSILDIDIAQGNADAPEDYNREGQSGAIGATFDAVGAEGVAELAGLFEQILADLTAIGEFFDDRAPESGAPQLDRLVDLLDHGKSIIKARLPAAAEGDEEGASGDPALQGAAPGATAAPPGALQTRQDAIRALDRVARFFAETEPTSPVPLLLDRAARLAESDFLTIIEDLAPDALVQAKLLRGRTSQEQDEG